MSAERGVDAFDHVVLESAFDEVEEIAKERGAHIETEGFGWIRWQWLAGYVSGEFAYVRVGALKNPDGSEETFTFKCELEDLNKLLTMEIYPR